MAVERGLLLLDKPRGPTSHAAVLAARRRLGVRRVGHTGTLDPFATGLLLLLIGSFTRAAEYFHLLSKTYDGTLELGRETSTHDVTGETTGTSEAWRDLAETDVHDALAGHLGPVLQVPPAFSAKQVAGRRAHEVARRGGVIELAPAAVHVHELRALSVELPAVRFRARVSTGTYLRALARDVGRALGCGAHLTALRRTRIGPFDVDDAAAPEDVRAGVETTVAFHAPATAVAWMPRRDLAPEEFVAIRHGRGIPEGEVRAAAPEVLAEAPAAIPLPVILLYEGELIAFAERRELELRPKKVFAA